MKNSKKKLITANLVSLTIATASVILTALPANAVTGISRHSSASACVAENRLYVQEGYQTTAYTKTSDLNPTWYFYYTNSNWS
ncbi:hypothetical protein K8F61_12420 [Microbacterium resistens]|uniref:Uncharacterized protein n=1 Tax=Microbacterium resistens TaxID=156977 RepID=A0ABY3RS05_9MICO|nr:hypothetical protein [Microbacterium resistens]UGS25481.1 hypothetical protein K8F61_12420 [Microbacterium resistens]